MFESKRKPIAARRPRSSHRRRMDAEQLKDFVVGLPGHADDLITEQGDIHCSCERPVVVDDGERLELAAGEIVAGHEHGCPVRNGDDAGNHHLRNALVKRRRQQVAGGDDAGQPIVLVQHVDYALLRADATARMAAWASEMICVVRRTTAHTAGQGRANYRHLMCGAHRLSTEDRHGDVFRHTFGWRSSGEARIISPAHTLPAWSDPVHRVPSHCPHH